MFKFVFLLIIRFALCFHHKFSQQNKLYSDIISVTNFDSPVNYALVWFPSELCTCLIPQWIMHLFDSPVNYALVWFLSELCTCLIPQWIMHLFDSPVNYALVWFPSELCTYLMFAELNKKLYKDSHIMQCFKVASILLLSTFGQLGVKCTKRLLKWMFVDKCVKLQNLWRVINPLNR